MTSTAVAAASWGRAKWRHGVAPSMLPGPLMDPAGSSPDGGTGDAIGLKVELYMGGAGWVDISDHVYYRDRIRIQRGRSNETSQTPPQTCGMTLNNRGGTFTPRNAAGPYYGLIGRNTPIRVSRMNNGERRYRYTGEVPSWPTTSDISGRDVYEQINAAGPLRRLVQGNAPLRSPMFRGVTSGFTSSLVTAYWPCEDGVNSTSIASGLSGGPAMAITGVPTFAANTSFACSGPLPTVNGSVWTAPIPPAPGTTANVFRCLMSVPAAGDNSAEIVYMSTSGTVANVQAAYDNNLGFEIAGKDALGNQLFGGTSSFLLAGLPVRVSVELIQNGPNITWAMVVLSPGASGAVVTSGSIAGVVGQATGIIVNNHISGAPTGFTNTAIGHITYQPTWDSLFDLGNPLNAWLGEPPDAVQTADSGFSTSRFTRLCLEQNITPVVVTSALGYDVDPGPKPPVGMGPQTIDTLTTLLQQVPDTAAGMLFEPRDQVGLAMRTRSSLYNQTAKLTLDHSQHQLSGPLNPVDDDQQVRNDVIVSRINGSSAQVTQTSGTLSVQPPPAGVGDYQTQYQLSLASDALLADAAGWRLHLGTVDEPRYPQLMLNLRHPTFTGSGDMMNAALTLDIGDRIVINNPPPELPPDPISLIVQGYSEVLGVYEHDMVITCSPESPYRVALLEDPVLGHADTDGSTLAAPVGGALNPNPLFAGGSLSSWSGVSCVLTAAGPGTGVSLPAGGPQGYGVLITPDGSLSNCAAEGASTSGAYVPAQSATMYWISALVYSPGGYSNVELGFDWYDASQNYISTSSLISPVPAGTWTALSTSQSLTAGNLAYLRPRIGQTGSPGSANLLYATAVVAWSGAFSVATTGAATGSPLWTTNAADLPFDIAVGGERMTVTNITGSSSPQPFTVARGVNGVIKAQTSGTDVRLWQPMILSL